MGALCKSVNTKIEFTVHMMIFTGASVWDVGSLAAVAFGHPPSLNLVAPIEICDLKERSCQLHSPLLV
jgi:hypothetical protein